MGRILVKPFDTPDERRPFEDKGRMDVINVGGGVVGRAVFEPGWKWSTHVGPIAGTRSCEVAHTGYIVSGRMRIVMDDGETRDVSAGDFVVVPPGHDAWVLGDEPAVMFDFGGIEDYARRRAGRPVEAGTPVH
ncbi:cupin domain-containing protein [Myxococcaceae bacterium GXIMD 01537]